MALIVKEVGNAVVLAEKSGISRRVVGSYLSGDSDPSREKLVAMAKASNVNIGWLASGDGPIHSNDITTMDDTYTMVPRYDVQASMGFGSDVQIEQIVDHLAFKTDWLQYIGVQKGEIALISAAGDSMEPTVVGGDLLILDMRKGMEWRDGIYVLRVDGDLLAKRLQRSMDGGLLVRSDNPAYREEVITLENLDQVQIVGRVAWFGRTM